ncbi:hypothetical protein WJX79_007543 [Trebouxia sp. C0005]
MESMLSGELTQVRKNAYVAEAGEEYHPDRHRSCTIYAGTLVQQVWNAEDAEEEVLVMICRTGMHTSMGCIIRQLLTPTKVYKDKEPLLRDIRRLYFFALVLQCFILIPYMLKASQHHQSTSQVIYRLLDLVTFVAPPGVPLLLLVLSAVAMMRLRKLGLVLLHGEVVKQGAAVDVVCFDKTGTLTHSTAELHGVLPVQQAAFGPLQSHASRWTNQLRQAFAVCHSLSMVSKSVVAGDDMERTLFKTVEARFLDRATVVLPRQPTRAHRSSSLAELSIIRVLEFSSTSLRSGVVVLSKGMPRSSGLLFLKGAPSVIRQLVQPASVPSNFDQVVDDYSSKCFRLLAVAAGVIPHVDQLDLPRMTQQQVEAAAVTLQLLGLVVLNNSVRPDSKETISQVQDGGGMRTMMITGDYHHTAIAVAKHPHQKGQVMDLLGMMGVHQIFKGQSRFIPGLGMTTMFCGDGINDLAALAAADVGMAIGATDAVIAAALSTEQGSVAGATSFIKLCKASHAIFISLLKYMVVYQCIVAQASMAAFFVDGSSLDNLQSSTIDVQAMAIAMAACLNPVTSLAWLVANLQLFAPLFSLTVDTKRFCEPVLRTKPLLITVGVYTILSYVAILVRPDQSINQLRLYNFSQSFRLQFAAVLVAGIVAYILMVHAARRLLHVYGRRRLRPV